MMMIMWRWWRRRRRLAQWRVRATADAAAVVLLHKVQKRMISILFLLSFFCKGGIGTIHISRSRNLSLLVVRFNKISKAIFATILDFFAGGITKKHKEEVLLHTFL